MRDVTPLIGSFQLPEFIDQELELFHNVKFEEQNGLQKILMRFENLHNHKLAEVDVSKLGCILYFGYICIMQYSETELLFAVDDVLN